jgi:hypothetical protein
MEIEKYINAVIAGCQVENGFLATAENEDNYQRVWSRDSAILALALLVEGKSSFFPTIRKTIYALMAEQSEIGIIPSNISAQKEEIKTTSYGSLVGRVDATSWWIIQALSYLRFNSDETAKEEWKPGIYRALNVLKSWEFNERNLIYTPIGGNWADEYISNGYTLYDNLLRFWAVKLAAEMYDDEKLKRQQIEIHQTIHANFNPQFEANSFTIHKRIHADFQSKMMTFWPSSFSPMNYDLRWDMAANALAMLLGFNTNSMSQVCNELYAEYSYWMLPVFHPVITEKDPDWVYLAENYNYNFKNYPNQFHNGGSWPVMLGLFCAGLSQTNQNQLAKRINDEYNALIVASDNYQFHEYFDPVKGVFGGMKHMCFSASGWLFMQQSMKENKELSKLL